MCSILGDKVPVPNVEKDSLVRFYAHVQLGRVPKSDPDNSTLIYIAPNSG